MSEEALESIRMGVALMFLSAILVYVVFNTRSGKYALNATLGTLEEAACESDRQAFSGFAGDGMSITAAAAYAFIGYHEDAVISVTCYLHDAPETGYAIDDICLRTHLRGKLRMAAVYDESEGGYRISLYKEQGDLCTNR